MKLIKRVVAGLGACTALAITLGVVASGCVEAEAQFYIAMPLPVKNGMDGVSCEGSEDEGCASLSVAQNTTNGCFLVASGLIPRAKDDTNHPETNRIILNQVDLELLDSSGAAIDTFSAPANGLINPASPEGGSFAKVSLPIVRSEGLAQLMPGSRFVIGIILKGRTTGGLDIETPEFFLSGVAGGACGVDQKCCATL
ncbi:MAG: hypothetical protein U0414_02040 [Polyangiaceae bacterium]